MDFTELVNAVYVETNRPDLIDQTKQAVRSATLKMHGMDYFPEDILAAQLTFDTAAWVQQFDRGILSRFRKVAYARKNDPALQPYQLNPYLIAPLGTGDVSLSYRQRTGVIKWIAPDDLFDDYEIEKLDVGYQAGRNLLIKSSTQFQFLLIGWYAFPDVVEANYASWVAEEYPFAIIYSATAQILTTKGYQEAARKYDSPASDTHDGGLVQNEIKRILADKILVGLTS